MQSPAVQPPAVANFHSDHEDLIAMASIRIVVSSKDHKASALVPRLQAHGMKVDAVMETIGVITGEIAEHQLPALTALPGLTVEREGAVQLEPPDAPVQ